MKPHLALIATGGTIAGVSPTPGAPYQAGVLSAEALLQAVPALSEWADWTVVAPFSIDSVAMTPNHWQTMGAAVLAAVADSTIAGVVVTHGTDTLEESALLLALICPPTKPVVITAALRPADDPQPDGPANLRGAAQAACAKAVLGVSVYLGGELLAAQGLYKHASAAQGFVGQPALAPVHEPLLVLPSGVWPKVVLLHGYPGLTASDILAAAQGAAGLVLVGYGAGLLAPEWYAPLAQLVMEGCVVVRASRVRGSVAQQDDGVDDTEWGWVAAGRLSGAQARVMLILALANGRNNVTALQACFNAR